MNIVATSITSPEPPGRIQPGNKHDAIMDGFIHLAPRTHDISLIGEHIPNISRLATDLEQAVQAGWSRRHDIRYSNVDVLLLRWAEDDLGVVSELKDLQHVFADLYNFKVEAYDIPSHKPDKALTRRVLDFLEDDKEDTLFIFYYAGHGKTSQQSNEGAVWFANRGPGSPSLPSKGIQSKFEEADADVLLLYDCCNAAATTASPSFRGHKGVTEVIAACGYESIAPEVGKHSFSNALIETLAAASKELPISVAELHARVLSRLKCWTPSFVKDAEGKFAQDAAGRLKHEIQPRRTPIYGILCETEPRRSIALGPMEKQDSLPNILEPRSSSGQSAIGSTTPTGAGPHARRGRGPLQRDQNLSAWKECLLRQLPSEAKDIKIEGIYGSFSTLLLLRVPVVVWSLLPPNSAYTFVGFITSENMAVIDSQPGQAGESIKNDLPSSCLSGSSTHVRQSLSVPQPTESKSNEPEALTRRDSLFANVTQERIVPGVNGPDWVTEIPPSLTALNSQNDTELAIAPLVLGSSYKDSSNSMSAFQKTSHGVVSCELEEGAEREGSSHTKDDGRSAKQLKVEELSEEPQLQPNPNELHGRWSPERDSRKTRVARPKVKNGCFTCKARRVKCDETKPHCLRCQKFGRVCDGYPSQPSHAQPRFVSVNPYQPSQPTHFNQEESRYFQIYREEVADKMSGYFNPIFWTDIVLQTSQAVPAIHHAIIAIGALYKGLEIAPAPGLKVNIFQSIDKRHHEFAVLQYLKAIQSLNSYISKSTSPQLRSALTACILFVCFEIIQSSYASATRQFHGGLKILRSYYRGKPNSPPRITEQNLPEEDSSSPKSEQITQAVRNQTEQGIVFKEKSIVSLKKDYVDGENSLQQTIESHPVEKSDAAPLDQYQQKGLIPLRRVMAKTLPIDTEHWRSQDDSKATSRTANEHSVHSGRDASPSSSAFDDRSSRHSPQPSEIFSSIVETKISAPSTTSENPLPAPHNPPSVISPLYVTQAKGRPSSSKRPRLTPPPDPAPPLLHNNLAIEETIIRTLIRLNGPGLFFGKIPNISPVIWDINKVYHLPIPTAFSNFESAHRSWDFLMDRALQFYRCTLFNRTYRPQSSASPETISDQYTSYMSELTAFKNAFEPILSVASTSEGIVKNPAALVVSLYYRCTVIMLAIVTSDSEMVYDSFLSDFRYIVRTCANLIAHNATPVPRFSLDVGIVPPLYLTAMKCRHPGVRREAIDLLLSSPRQEGMWDSVLYARIGRWIMSCEKEEIKPTSVDVEPLRKSSGFVQVQPRFEEGERKVAETVTEAIEKWLEKLSEHADVVDGAGMEVSDLTAEGLERSMDTLQSDRVKEEVLGVLEENRVQLTMVEYHMSERYLKAKCQKALLDNDGTRHERETVIAW